MSIFKGDRVIRVDGTANGFRRNETFEAVDVSRTHIKVKNAAGLISKWFERKDFMLWRMEAQRVTEYVVLAKVRGGHEITPRIFQRSLDAVEYCSSVEAAGNVVLAKKKVIIPYQEAGL